MESLSFDSMAKLYDETRRFDQRSFVLALDYLTERFPPQTHGRIFEPGIGTGRIAVPLAKRGYSVTGVDISPRMLAGLGKHLDRARHPLPVSLHLADVLSLPYCDAAFGMVVAAHLFYFIRPWQEATNELLRVLRNDGPLLLLHTGTGAEIPFLNERYRELCDTLREPIPDIGVRSTAEVADHLAGRGFCVEWVRGHWEWVSRLRLGEALGYVEARAYSFTTFASDTVHAAVMARLEAELLERFGSLSVEIEVPNQVYLVVVTR